MAKKPRTDLTVEQELVIRDFLDRCVDLSIALDPMVIGSLIQRMGYKIVAPGKLVRADKEIKYIFGDPDPFRNVEDEYGPDGEALRGAVSEDTDTDEASSSESPEGDEVGSLLQQDV